MKRIALAIPLLILPFMAYAGTSVPGCYNWDTKCIQKAYDREAALDEEIASHRRWMQGHINEAAEKQREVDQMIRNQPKLDAREMIAEACRQTSIQETQLRFGYIKSNFYSATYGACLKANGISYD